MQTLFLIRHTRPDIAPGLCYGQLDIDLADSFAEEANAVLNWLPPLDLIISSPLLRTRKLAEFLAQTANCKRETDLRLMEKNFGVWEGRAWDDIARHEIDAWANNVMGYAPPGGESAQQVMQRVQSFLHDLAQPPNGHVGDAAPDDANDSSLGYCPAGNNSQTAMPVPLSPGTLPCPQGISPPGSRCCVATSARQAGERDAVSLREIGVNQNIALVAHGGSIRAILAQIAGVPLTDTLNWKIDYGAVIAVRIGRE